MILKICGITRASDLQICADEGVSWIGINFWAQSKRAVSLAQGLELAEYARKLGLDTVALLVNEDLKNIENVAETGLFHYLQLYGALANAQFDLPVIRPVSVDRNIIPTMPAISEGRLLLEAKVDGYGGAGQAFDWKILQKISGVDQMLIGGGVNPENIGELLNIVRPYGVDVATGSESAPGLKDAAKIRTLMDAIKRHQ